MRIEIRAGRAKFDLDAKPVKREIVRSPPEKRLRSGWHRRVRRTCSHYHSAACVVVSTIPSH